jgi:RNA polymerase sigma factor (sigma-70 family)
MLVQEPDGFADFVRGHSRRLQRAAWLLTGDWALAEDLVQTALAATWLHWSTLTRPDAPQLYVRRVMVTTYLRWQRRRWNGEIASDGPAGAGRTGRADWTGATEGADWTNRADGTSGRPASSDAYTRSDLRQSLQRALATLPPRQRVVLTLRYFVDLSEADTADALSCSVGAVKSHTAKAMANLRRSGGLAELRLEEVR